MRSNARMRNALMILLSLLSAPLVVHGAEPAKPRVTAPADRAIFQRDKKNIASVPVVCTGIPARAQTVEVSAVNRVTQQPATDWIRMTGNVPGNMYRARLSLPAGWYRIEVRAQRDGKDIATAVLEHVGVGEVFVTCGQSNSANHGKPPQKAHDERVSTCDFQTGRWTHGDDPQPGATGKGGSPWPILGDLLAKKLHMPVGFICVGVGATPVSYWTPKGAGYPRLKRALQLAGVGGVRAVLWHQGESDSIAGTSANAYAAMLKQCIVQSRKDAGWAVPWGVAIASYHPDRKATAALQAAVVAGQKKVITTVPGVFKGAETDSYHLRGWLSDSVHFNSEGLAAHAKGWATALKVPMGVDK